MTSSDDGVVINLPARDNLNEFDQQVVAIVKGLLQDFQDARKVVVRDGLMMRDNHGDLSENPAATAQRRASAELRAWVKERPDLFGAKSQHPSASAPTKLNRYRRS